MKYGSDEAESELWVMKLEIKRATSNNREEWAKKTWKKRCEMFIGAESMNKKEWKDGENGNI